jgi:cysteinyl-tRNA synthetase, unknown class
MKNACAIVLVFCGFLSALMAAEPASFTYVLQADRLAKTKVAAIEQLANCGRSWIVLDAAFDDTQPWQAADLQTIRSRMAVRKIIAYLSIGEAESYRWYWKKEWLKKGKPTALAPAWLGKENPDWKGNYQVKYWHAEWQTLMLQAVDEAMSRGFDGIYLDIVDGFETYEQDRGNYLENRLNPETKQSYRRDMVDWVKRIAERARTTLPEALVIPQNGSQLLRHADFVTTVSGIGLEDLFTDGDRLQPKSHTTEVLGDLDYLAGTGNPVMLTEYGKKATRKSTTMLGAKEQGIVWLLTGRNLDTLGQSGR